MWIIIIGYLQFQTYCTFQARVMQRSDTHLENDPWVISLRRETLSPARWHGKHTYLSSLEMLGTTQLNFITRSHNIYM